MKDERRRYVVFTVTAGTSTSELKKILRSSPGSKSFRIIQYEENSGRGILRCPHNILEKVRSLEERTSPFKIIGVSGTIKQARRKFWGVGTVR